MENFNYKPEKLIGSFVIWKGSTQYV